MAAVITITLSRRGLFHCGDVVEGTIDVAMASSSELTGLRMTTAWRVRGSGALASATYTADLLETAVGLARRHFEIPTAAIEIAPEGSAPAGWYAELVVVATGVGGKEFVGRTTAIVLPERRVVSERGDYRTSPRKSR